MKISIKPGSILKSSKGAVAAFLVWEDSKPSGELKEADGKLGGVLAKLAKSGEFKGAAGSCKVLPTYGRLSSDKMILVGMGKKETLESCYIAGCDLTRALRSSKASRVFINLDLDGAKAREFLLGALNADHEYSLKAKYAKPAPKLELTLGGSVGAQDRRMVDEVLGLNAGTHLTKDLVAAPANYATPRHLAAAAQKVAREHRSVRTKVLGLSEIRKLKMGGLLAVNAGSAEEPRFIVMEYRGASASSKPLVFVGKGLTFDSGGISIKPSAGMEGMKWDMGGGGAVIGAIKAIAAAGYRVNCVGIVPSTENLPDGKAYKPSDVITMMSGHTVEVTNTDAEGRMILGDALHYASTRYPKARCIVDLATLTGACAMFLGEEFAGLMTPSDSLAKDLLSASADNFDHLWRLPMIKLYEDQMKSDIADLVNSKPKRAGAMTAAGFLKAFVDPKIPWAHLDIAGVAWREGSAPGRNVGATGFGVQLLAALARAHAR
ncbi:MAG: leucyl aminopeptidase [Planctomycetota bacterium]